MAEIHLRSARPHAGAAFGGQVDETVRIAGVVLLLCGFVHVAGIVTWRILSGDEIRFLVFGEDRIVECLSALAFLSAFAIGLLALLRGRPRHHLDRLALAGVAALGLLGCLDEISFGERLFGFTPPMVAGIKLDGAHDLVEIANTLRREWMGPVHAEYKAAILVAGLAAVLTAAWCAWRFRGQLFGPGATVASLGVVMLATAFVAELGLSSIIDIRVVTIAGGAAIEECAELNAALLLAAIAWLLGRGPADARNRLTGSRTRT